MWEEKEDERALNSHVVKVLRTLEIPEHVAMKWVKVDSVYSLTSETHVKSKVKFLQGRHTGYSKNKNQA